MKRLIISEILYWIIAAISVFQVFQNWTFNRQKSYLFLVFGVVSIFMALFRRHFRKKYYNSKSDNS
ncbi:MAG: hypothetical protein P8L83_00255 [Flavobacteriaceae bacterium]|nr:hypothetical protein [Flavobacteriaceae bacterium]